MMTRYDCNLVQMLKSLEPAFLNELAHQKRTGWRRRSEAAQRLWRKGHRLQLGEKAPGPRALAGG